MERETLELIVALIILYSLGVMAYCTHVMNERDEINELLTDAIKLLDEARDIIERYQNDRMEK